ncbi:hypothetical protein EsH8_IX_000298 [Colletotrichum jinshuiense]
MAPSLLSTLSSALLLTSTVSAQKSYQQVDSYDSTNFLEKFGFFVSDHSTGNYNDVDPTGGYVSYKSAEEAQNMGLLKTVDGDLYLGVDSASTLDASGTGRSSVRIQSHSKYKQGLFVATFSHLPKPVCGAWPAFWTVGNPWPAAGEIDIVETWNEDNVNKVVLHTDGTLGECRIDGQNMTGTISKPNCANYAAGQSDNEGCAGLDPAAPFGSAEGGVYAMQWTDDAIRVWGFTHANAPADIATNPNPETWGTPSFTTSTCAADKLFGEAQLIMNIDFCGVAGQDSIWSEGGCQAKAGGATCKEWVASNPAAFAEVYFQLKSIKIYSLQEGEATQSTTVASQIASTVVSSAVSSAVAETSVVNSVVPTSAASSIVASAEPVESGAVTASATASVIASEKPVETSAEAPVETPAETLTTRLATSTVYETNIETVTSCAPEITNCPANSVVLVTKTKAIYTTICPVVDVPTSVTVSKTVVVNSKTTIVTEEVVATTTAVPAESYTPTKPAGGKPAPVTTEVPAVITTYKTNIVTVTSCGPEVTNCPARSTTVLTQVVPTVIPAVPTTAEAEKPVPVTTEVPAVITTYKTNIVTVTSCGPEVTNCPARSTTVLTQVVPTVIPAVPTTAEAEKPVPVTTEVPAVITTYKTNIYTITSCAPEVTNCPARSTAVVTEIVPVTTAEGEKPVPVSPTQSTAPGFPGVESPSAPGSAKPSTPAPEYSTLPAKSQSSVPANGVPTAGVPAAGVTTSAQKPVAETPGVIGTDVETATAPLAVPTTLVVAPSSPYNSTLNTGLFPIGTGSATPATTTGPVQAGAGKLSSGVLILAAALAFVI